ncbi:2-dehydro-3-deoxyphosphogluconate aldolase/(4S)-4-hydroxy-2-oxoglutarate aldolase [Streptacidiphilus sp. MAP12-16]|uniref:bifunctional 4-hydroxy-2-oxoglutarate aldolase/2-dehydro-3-deoxy-phosphogluconate aldolase n=1 Tax=Streptacidiphilus sp. MAP12-16 TaxID=3156300 RepID=UPI003513CA69
MPASTLLDVLRQDRLLAVLRGTDADALTACAAVLADNGVRAVELTLSSEAGLEALRRTAAGLPSGSGVLLGAGTVLTRGQARAAVDAGARYLVTPGVAPDVLAEAADLGVPVLCGALTPSEAMTAVRLGAAAVKLFPAHAVGGARYLRDLRAPFPDVPFIAIGGIGLDDVADYLAAGALAVGVGSPLLREAARDSSPAALDALAARARAYLAATGVSAGSAGAAGTAASSTSGTSAR